MTVWNIVYIFIILVLLLGLMYGLLWLMKRYFYSNKKFRPNALGIEVISTQLIMPKKFISAVKIHDKIYLLGISEQSVNFIDKLDEIPEDLNLEKAKGQQGGTFLDALKKNLKGQ